MARKPVTPQTMKMDTTSKPDYDPALAAAPVPEPVPAPAPAPAPVPVPEPEGTVEVTHAIVAGNEDA